MRTQINKKIFDQTWIISTFKTSTEAPVDDEVLEGFLLWNLNLFFGGISQKEHENWERIEQTQWQRD